MSDYPLIGSHIHFAHRMWEKHLLPSDWAIDATCGNGQDTLKLAQLVGPSAGVIAIDIQKIAIERTKSLLSAHPEKIQKVHLFEQSHALFPPLAISHPIGLIVYNLGYLPQADKSWTTLTESTLASLQEALKLLRKGGLISITCYPGHKEGEKELFALSEALKKLEPDSWKVDYYSKTFNKSPSCFFIKNNYELNPIAN
ncbi:MAG: methyltransferase domain-containing protein [Chlamydiales bacterium]|nr:methyltransferase domain-containing protein [Chlamydiales bacterium]